MRSGIDWDSLPLGQESDESIAIKIGYNATTVGYHRRKRGILPYCKHVWDAGIKWDEQPLGELPDVVIARRLLVSHASVANARKVRGIERTEDSYRIGRLLIGGLCDEAAIRMVKGRNWKWQASTK